MNSLVSNVEDTHTALTRRKLKINGGRELAQGIPFLSHLKPQTEPEKQSKTVKTNNAMQLKSKV